MFLLHLVQMMAGCPVAGGDLLELRHLGGAPLVCVGAAGAEAAAGRRVQGAGHVALQHDALGLACREGVCHRDGRDQAAGVGVDAVGDQLVAVGQLHQLAQVHDADAVGDVLDHAQVMGDEQVGQAHFLLQVLEHIHDLCLNDAVVTKAAIARVVHLSVKCDGVQAMEFGGDGVIVATPTGSTAYSLSAGGPIVEPEANNILVTPICAHDVGSRCMVASEKRVITVELTRNARRNAYLSVDGGRALRLNLGDKTVIRKADLTTKLVRLQERSFYDLVNMKFRQG